MQCLFQRVALQPRAARHLYKIVGVGEIAAERSTGCGQPVARNDGARINAPREASERCVIVRRTALDEKWNDGLAEH